MLSAVALKAVQHCSKPEIGALLILLHQATSWTVTLSATTASEHRVVRVDVAYVSKMAEEAVVYTGFSTARILAGTAVSSDGGRRERSGIVARKKQITTHRQRNGMSDGEI